MNDQTFDADLNLSSSRKDVQANVPLFASPVINLDHWFPDMRKIANLQTKFAEKYDPKFRYFGCGLKNILILTKI